MLALVYLNSISPFFVLFGFISYSIGPIEFHILYDFLFSIIKKI